jgi:hypothetical protein
MVIEILLNDEIQTLFYSNEITFLKGLKYMCIHHWKKINNELLNFSFGQNVNKTLNIKVGICAMFTMKHRLNKMHPNIFPYQVGWFGGYGFDFHPRGASIKPHKWYGYGQQWYIDQLFPMPRLLNLRYLHRFA